MILKSIPHLDPATLPPATFAEFPEYDDPVPARVPWLTVPRFRTRISSFSSESPRLDVQPASSMDRILSSVVFLFLASCAFAPATAYEPRLGDVVFQTSNSDQSMAIQLVTKSRYTHCGIVVFQGGAPMVLEAVGPVKLTPLQAWIARGKGGSVVAKRLRDAETVLTSDKATRLDSVARSFLGRPYDPLFEWSDRAIYCSELVHKAYERALAIELAQPQRIGSLDLSSGEAQRIAQARWGGAPPADQAIVSPAALFSSSRLVTVHTR